MKPDTLDNLEDCLDKEFGWRKKELSSLRTNLRTSLLPGLSRNTAIRSAIALSYAHWEGGVKNSAEYYLCHVSMRRIQVSALHPNISAVCLKASFDQIGSSKRHQIYAEKVKEIISNFDNLSNIPWETAVDTGSNLNHSRLIDILGTMAIDTSVFDTKQKFIDETLLASRNRIAHGEELLPSIDDARDSIAIVLDMLTTIKNSIVTAAQAKAYKIK